MSNRQIRLIASALVWAGGGTSYSIAAAFSKDQSFGVAMTLVGGAGFIFDWIASLMDDRKEKS